MHYSNTFDIFMMAFLGIWLIIMLIFLAVGVAAYILQGIGLYKMAKNTGSRHAWCAWIPVGHYFLVGYLADRYNRTRGKNTKFAPVLLALPLVTVLGGILLTVLFIFSMNTYEYYQYYSPSAALLPLLVVLFDLCCIAFVVINCIASYSLYQDYEPSNAVLYTVLTVFGFDFIAKFLCRNNVPVGVAGRVYPKQPKYGAAPVQTQTPPSGGFGSPGSRQAWSPPPRYAPPVPPGQGMRPPYQGFGMGGPAQGQGPAPGIAPHPGQTAGQSGPAYPVKEAVRPLDGAEPVMQDGQGKADQAQNQSVNEMVEEASSSMREAPGGQEQPCSGPSSGQDAGTREAAGSGKTENPVDGGETK